ncbi:MAG: sulfotransferase family 2 domain-containing protein [Pseudomonadota bacterium]
MLDSNAYSILVPEYDAVYIDIAKVASSSIKSRLASILNLPQENNDPHTTTFERPTTPDASLPTAYPGLFSFAFVRNPWDRLVSCYRDKILGQAKDFTAFNEDGVAHCLAGFDAFYADMSFEAFIAAVCSIDDDDADEHCRAQSAFITNVNGEISVDFVGRFETLSDDFNTVANKLRWSLGSPLPRLQSTPRTDYREYYNAETTRLVEQRFLNDITLFDYQFSR